MRLLTTTVILAATAAPAGAHFIWITPAKDDPTGKVIITFGDRLSPENPELLKTIAHTELAARGEDGSFTPLKLPRPGSEDEGFILVEIPGQGGLVTGHCVWGVYILKELRETTPFLLHYHAKAVLDDPARAEVHVPTEGLKAELIPAYQDGSLTLRLLYQGKPVPEADVTVIVPGQKQILAPTTDERGECRVKVDREGVYGVWALAGVEKTPGTHDGKKYEEVRHYATLTVTIPETR